jgi:hypothetical protein
MTEEDKADFARRQPREYVHRFSTAAPTDRDPARFPDTIRRIPPPRLRSERTFLPYVAAWAVFALLAAGVAYVVSAIGAAGAVR